MKDRLTCTACDQPIPNGDAVLTSRLFEQRAWHREHAPVRQAVPEQRQPGVIGKAVEVGVRSARR